MFNEAITKTTRMLNVDRAIAKVQRELFSLELDRLAYWTEVKTMVTDVATWPLPWNDEKIIMAMGLYHPAGMKGERGTITVPYAQAYYERFIRALHSQSIPRDCNLVDVLRHEYGHALADSIGIHGNMPAYWGKPDFISIYALTSPDEDFAECFMFYLKHHGILPLHKKSDAMLRKWNFLERSFGKLKKSTKLSLTCTCVNCENEIVLQDGPGDYVCPGCDYPLTMTSQGAITS